MKHFSLCWLLLFALLIIKVTNPDYLKWWPNYRPNDTSAIWRQRHRENCAACHRIQFSLELNMQNLVFLWQTVIWLNSFVQACLIFAVLALYFFSLECTNGALEKLWFCCRSQMSNNILALVSLQGVRRAMFYFVLV